MSTDTILRHEEIGRIALSVGCDPEHDDGALVVRLARAIEQAVLQSYESQLLRLLVDIRFAAGDDGKRMQGELVEHIAALRKDAERYRHLRNRPRCESRGEVSISLHEGDRSGRYVSGADADAAIDAAIRSEQ